MTIAQGSSVAIKGASGCGKSTLIKILTGLLDPQEGAVKVGGIDINHIGRSRFRSLLGCVLQDDQMFSGTIADNISFHSDDAPMSAIEKAAKAASIHDEIINMPMGYHTLVGDMGSALSGGQRQRVLLARAIFKTPQILVLDEATSHVDGARDRDISERLKILNVTKVVISHREDIISAVDEAYLFESGRVIRIAQPERASGTQQACENQSHSMCYQEESIGQS